jgi:hypothetical protein
MKLMKTLIAVAALSAGLAAHAESNVNTGATAGLAASAKLDLRVVVPRVIFLQVGTGTLMTNVTTVDVVTFTLGTTDIGANNTIAGGSTVSARVLGNGGNVSLTASGVTGGPTNGTTAIAWSKFTPSSNNASLPHPAIGNGVAGAASTLTAVAGVVNQTATWSFNYNNDTVLENGNYTGRVTYTAALP